MNNTLRTDAEPARHAIEFTASGSEYFRIWIVNLLLTVVTLGIYLPWAKVRKLRYFYSNTWIDGDALDFHGEPGKMLRGTAVAAGFLAAFSIGSRLSGWAALVAALAFVGIWPALFRASMRFRLANTSWRGLRFRFTGSTAGAYACLLPPLALGLLPFALLGVAFDGPDSAAETPLPMFTAGAVMVGLAIFALASPYFVWRVRRYQHDNYAIGELRTRLKLRVSGVYGVFLKLIGAGLIAIVIATVIFGAAGFASRNGGGGSSIKFLGIAFAFCSILLFNLVPKSYLTVRLQNLFWSKTGNDLIRFKSDMPFLRYLGLQCRNSLLIFLTLGLYWPFAVVSTRRAKLEAIELYARIALVDITQLARRENPGATGDMAADLFGMDIGM